MLFRSADLRGAVQTPFDALTISTWAEVDGVPLAQLDQNLVWSPLFTVTVPENGFAGTPTGTGQAVAKGWFFILAPPAKGEHTIHVRYEIAELPGLIRDTTYHVTVE